VVYICNPSCRRLRSGGSGFQDIWCKKLSDLHLNRKNLGVVASACPLIYCGFMVQVAQAKMRPMSKITRRKRARSMT
jgi:hypothetical protein